MLARLSALAAVMQMPADNLPEYVKGQHLRDSDLALFEQARAEMVR